MPSYHSHTSVVAIVHSIATPIQSVRGEALCRSLFFALACEGSMDLVANKQVLVCTGTLLKREVQTTFVGVHDLRNGTALNAVDAYKQTMHHAR